jgi:hypothetical protein
VSTPPILVIRTDNRQDRGQLLRTRRPSYTVGLEALYPLKQIPDFYRNDGLHELLGLPHDDLLIEAGTNPAGVATRIAASPQRAVIIDHEALHPEFSGFWENAALGAALAAAIKSGALLWIGFQSSGYVPAWLKEILPGGVPWEIVAAGEADSLTGLATDHPLAIGLNAGVAVDWHSSQSWRALRELAVTEPFDASPQPSEFGSLAWLGLPESGWQRIATRWGRPEHVALAESVYGTGRIVLDQTLALHGTNIDSANARHFASALRNYLGTSQPTSEPLRDGFIALSAALAPHHAKAETVEYLGIPFTVHGDENLLAYSESEAELPVGFLAERLFLLGGLLSWPYSTGTWFVDARDFSQDFFIGDSGGSIRLVYQDGAEDVVPLIFGVTIIWQENLFKDEHGWRPPFDDGANRALLFDTLLLQRAEGNGIRAWVLDLALRSVPLDRIVFERAPGKIGHPIFAAVTAFKSGAPNPPPRTDKTIDTALPFPDQTARILPLQRCLYTYPEDYEAAPLDRPPDFEGAKIRFRGNRSADVLSFIYAANMANLRQRLHPEHGMVSLNSGPVWGFYRAGNGTWRGFPPAETWEPDGWSRDNGRAGVERVSLGLQHGCDREIALFDRHLACGTPPHMERNVCNMPQIHEWERTSLAGNVVRVAPENDGHGLVMLYRAAFLRHHPEHADRLWAAGQDYAEWICFLVENPITTDQLPDTLYTVSECSGFGGLDVYSHALCRAGLLTMARLARCRNETRLAERWEGYAARLSRSMLKHLVAGLPARWKASPISDWQSGAEALAPLLSLADWLTYDPSDAPVEEQIISRRTFDALTSGGKWWMRQRMIGYDLALVTQAALLLDDVRSAQLIDALCEGVYSARGPDPWIISEGSVRHESGKMWYRGGMGGNLVHLAETLKVVRLIAGVDDLTPGTLRLLPRLPVGWTGIEIKDYPISALCANDTPARLSYSLNSSASEYALDLQLDRPLRLSIRLDFRGRPEAAAKVLVNGHPPVTLLRPAAEGFAWLDLEAADAVKIVA